MLPKTDAKLPAGARFALMAGAALAVFAIAPVAEAASSTVLGTGRARLCFEAAEGDGSSLYSLSVCDQALREDALSRADRAATHVNRGVLRLRRREGPEALADFDAAVRLLPELAEAHANRGAALILLRRPEDAVAAITRGLELGMADAHEGHFNRGLAHEQLEDIPSAYRDYAAARDLAPEWQAPREELQRFQVEAR